MDGTGNMSLRNRQFLRNIKVKARPDGLVRDALMGKDLVVAVPPPVPAVVQDNACLVPVVPVGSLEPVVSSWKEVGVQPG